MLRIDPHRVQPQTKLRWRYALIVAGLTAVVLTFMASSLAGAARPNESATEQLSLSYEVPVTNPGDGNSYPSVVLVTSAQLSTQAPDGSGVSAPNTELYLTWKMSSGPVQRQFGDTEWGDFFSEMTPLPASAFSCRSSRGRTFPVVRSNPANEQNNFNSNIDDGLVDATYYCLVPDTFRNGSVVMGPSTTVGSEYTGFTGANPVVLKVGGPITIALHFPEQLTVAPTPTTTISFGSASGGTGASPTSSGQLGALLLLGIVGGVTAYMVRRRPVTASSEPASQSPQTNRNPASSAPLRAPVGPSPTPWERHGPSEYPKERVVQEPSAASTSRSTDSPVHSESPKPALTIRVLGSLEFDPPLRGLSDGARAVLCYLAFHRERITTAAQMQNALWPLMKTQRDVSPRTMHNYVSEARRAVGVEVLPESTRGSGYRLQSFTTDFDQFTDLIEVSRMADRPESIALRRRALQLVREHPFASESSNFFEWTRGDGVERQIVRGVSDVALRLGQELMGSADLDGAEEVVSRGLLVAPGWLPLWELRTDVVLARGNSAELAQLWSHAGPNLTAKELESLKARTKP